MQALFSKLSLVEAERFITLLLRESFNYTEWQQRLWENESVEEIGMRAKAHWEATHSKEHSKEK